MTEKRSLRIGARLLWGLVAGGLAFVVLSVSGPALPPAALYGLSAAFAVAGMLLGPVALDLLGI